MQIRPPTEVLSNIYEWLGMNQDLKGAAGLEVVGGIWQHRDGI